MKHNLHELENKIRTLILSVSAPNQEKHKQAKEYCNYPCNLKIKYLEVKRNNITKIDEKIENYLDNLSKNTVRTVKI